MASRCPGALSCDMTEEKPVGQRRLCVWTETPEEHRHVQSRLPRFRRFLMPVNFQGRQLAEVINVGPAGWHHLLFQE